MEPSDAKFCHPYDPYEIQLSFMSSLYDCIQHGNVGIFESPTGTGKSLSLICGSLTWLRDHKRRVLEGDADGVAAKRNDWLAVAEKQNRRKALLRDREEFELRLAKIRHDEARSKLKHDGERPTKRAKFNHNKPVDEEEFLLDDYESSDESTKANSSNGNFSASTRLLLEKLQGTRTTEDETAELNDETKVIFCSRTHSQLTQFVNELRRVSLPHAVPIDGTDTSSPSDPVRHLPLGSRKTLCINDHVARLQSTVAINERCLELQKPGTAKDKKCPHLPNKENSGLASTFRDRAIANIRDIEDIAQLGREMSICPYYASRAAIAPSEVLTLPYPLLLQKSAREALGVSVKDNVVVIDEAHNLMDAVADTFSVSMRLEQLKMVTQQVTGYVQRFKNKLKGKNRVYITQLIRLMNSITDCLEKLRATASQQDVQVSAAQLMAGKGVDQIKPHKLLQYIHESKLPHKIEGYTELQLKQAGSLAQHRGLLMLFQSFLTALMNPDAEGRFFASKQDSDISIRYTLLDPREHFRDIVQEARAVILAGGTMSPMSDYAEHLFSYHPPEKLQTFSFGHVIPKENIFVQSITTSPSQTTTFDFTFSQRSQPTTIKELGTLLIRITTIAPDGVVVFFPSYDYLALVTKFWSQPQSNTNTTTILHRLSTNKPVFTESKSTPVDTLLHDYTTAITQPQAPHRGALLLAVIGGKLSEGINFSDALGRCVICVGLPFPNASSGEWKAKIEHVENKKFAQLRSGNNNSNGNLNTEPQQKALSESEATSRAKAAGREFYENACMRAVNQSIGRAIRHRGDWAAVLLVDRRFGTERIRGKLPGWIRGSLRGNEAVGGGTGAGAGRGWDETERDLRRFFEEKQQMELGIEKKRPEG